MRIVKLSDLSNDERKKVLEEQQARIQANRQSSEQDRVNANNQFNEYIKQNGIFDTNRHTTSMSSLLQAQKDISKERYNSFKKANGITLWDTVKDVAGGNLQRFKSETVNNTIQNTLDRNTRTEMARPLENYTKAKRASMQSVSNAVQEKAEQKRAKQEKENNKKDNRWILLNDTDKNQKEVLLNANNRKRLIEQQIEQENNKSDGNILEAVYKKKNNIQENKIKDFSNNKTNMYKKNLAINNQNSNSTDNRERNNNVLEDLEDIGGISGLGTHSTIENVFNFAKGVQDIWGLGKEVGLGASTGGKQVLNYLETMNELTNPNYKRSKEMQFMTSPNVSMEEKMAYKRGEKIETNLIKKSIRDSIAKDEQEIQEIQNSLNYKVSQKFGEIAPSMGQMLPGITLNAVNPVLGTSYFMTSAGGGYINDAINRGMSEEEAWRYGTIMGVLEGASESFITGQQVNKIVNAFSGKQISKKILDSYGFNIFENAIQEAVMEPAQEITAGIIGNKADWSNIAQRMTESGFNGALMGAITNGVTYGLEKSGIVYNKMKNNEQVTANEYKEALQENIDRFGKKTVEDSMKQGALETYEEINKATNLQQRNLANSLQSVYNSNNLDKVQNVPIESVLQLKTDGGYRSEQYIAELRKDIKAKGIKYPIELVRNSDGSIEIENGNHRLQVASELGLKEVPIKFVESWDSILGNIDKTEGKLIERLEVYNDRNNGNSGKIDITNGRSRTNEKYSSNNRNQFENRGTATGDDRLYNRVQEFDNRPSSTSTFKQDSKKIQELENTSSFNMQSNNTNLKQNTTNNQINSQMQQINQSENKMYQNGNREQIDNKQTIKGYHGTDSDFEKYSLKNFGKHDEGDFGKAVYFTTDKSTASKYGKNIKENDINLENPLIINSEQDYEKIWNKLAQNANIEKLSVEDKKLINDKYVSQSDKDYILYNTLTSEEKSNILQKMGYDGVIDNTYNQIAVFNPNSIANNQETVYNNTESKGDIYEQSQFTNQEERATRQSINEATTGDTRLSRQRNDTSIQQNSLYGERKYNKQEYRNWEQSIRPKEESNFTIEEKTIKDNIKRQYGKDIVFFDEENTNYNAGASIQNIDTIYINSKQANKFGLNKTALHETMESNIAHNQTLKQDIIIPAIEKIIDDSNFKQQKEHFWEGQTDKIPSDYAIAKDILCDRFAEMKSGESWDYQNVLSQETNMTIDYALENFHNQLYGKNIIEQNQLNKVKANTQSLGYKQETEGKQRKHYKSVMESEQVGEVGKQSAKSLIENDTYEPLSNIDTLARANENIQRNGVDNTYIAFRNKINSNERITLQDIATGERLIQIFSQGGDFDKVNGLVQDVAMLGTELGQQVQAMSLIKRMSPEGQLMYLNKMVDRLNLKENADLKVSDDMSKRILETKNEAELENVMTNIAVELGSQLPVTVSDKVRAWRYLSMLGNPKTHIKNLGANVAMNITQQTKNKVAGAMEDVVGIFNKDLERTKTLRLANKDQRSFAKQDAEFMKDKIDGGGKYDIKNAIESNKKQFNNKALNAIANFNSNMLEVEDNIFLKKAYRQALQNYMSANKLNSSDMQNSSVLQKAREYASYQAQEATFHQFSELARRLTEIENKGGVAGKALEAVIPFKKTPINIAKSGIEYSPIGLAKSFTYDIAQLNKKTRDYKTKLEKGFISEAEYKTGTSQLVTKTIDDMAKGLTGTSLAILGYALADMAILKAGNDGEDDEFKEKLGEQEYAIRIGDNTYTLDWVSPSAIPMFVGATVHDLIHSEKEDNSNTLNSLMTSSAKALEPMTEMSMLQGLTSAISSYEQGSSNMLFDLGGSAVSSYFGQFVPTALGQVAKTIDDKERDTSSTEKGLAKKVDQFKKQQMAKIPIVSKMLPVRKDVWGNEKTRDSNVLVRAYDVGLAPYNRKKVVEDYTEKELLKVFEDTGERSVLPGIPNKDITIDKQKYRLTAGEYNKAKETFGKTSKAMLDGLVKSKEYKSLTDEQKAEAINNIYSYAKEKIKVDYAKNKKKEFETTPSYNILKELNMPSNQSEFLSYSSKIKGIEKDKEKKQILSDGNYSPETKAIIYKNTLGKEDELYNNVLGKDNVNINEYLKYKLQEFESDKKDDGTKNGKSISGSKKKKVYDYVNKMNVTRQQRLAIIGKQYKLSRGEQNELYNYLNKLPMKSQEERLEVFSKYSSNFIIYKDDTMDFK